MAGASFPLIKGQVPTPGTPVTLALTLDVDPDNPLAGDLDRLNGQIHFWDGMEARRQKLTMILQFFKGEWWLNRDEGIPYFENVFGKQRLAIVRNVFRQALLACPGVAQIPILQLTLDNATRQLAVDWQVLFDDGTTLTSADFGPTLIKVP